MALLESVIKLGSISPSQVLADQALRTVYCQFLKRGTLAECCELLIECFGVKELLKCVQNLGPPPQSVRVVREQLHQPRVTDKTTPHERPPHKTTPHKTTPHKTTPHNSQNNTNLHEDVKEFFKKEFPDSKEHRIIRLERIARHIAEPKKINILGKFRADGGSTFTDPIMQATAMYQTIEKSSDRKYRVYFADAVERYTFSAVNDASGSAMKKTVAFNSITAQLNAERQQVVSLDSEGNKYLTIMEMGGAASLYSIDGAKTDIEKLNDKEIHALCGYRRIKVPEVEKVSRSADIEVAKSLRDDLHALGFKNTHIAMRNTRLTRLICETLEWDPEPNQRHRQQRANSNKQLRSNQTVFRPSDQDVVFHLENPSVSARNSRKRRKGNVEGHAQPITSNIEVSTSRRTSIPEPQRNGSTTRAEGQHFSEDVPSHSEHLEEECSMQHGNNIALALCEHTVVEAVVASKTLREAEVTERQITDDCAEHSNHWSSGNAGLNVSMDVLDCPESAQHNIPQPSPSGNLPNEQLGDANLVRVALISQNPINNVGSVVADNHNFPAPQPSGQVGPEHSPSPSHISSTYQEVTNSLAVTLVAADLHTHGGADKNDSELEGILDSGTNLGTRYPDCHSDGFVMRNTHLGIYEPDNYGEQANIDWEEDWFQRLGVDNSGRNGTSFGNE